MSKRSLNPLCELADLAVLWSLRQVALDRHLEMSLRMRLKPFVIVSYQDLVSRCERFLFAMFTAVLSRQTAGTRGSCLILNLLVPRSIREIIDEIWPAVPYCVDLIGGPYIETNDGVWSAWRPPHARRAIEE